MRPRQNAADNSPVQELMLDKDLPTSVRALRVYGNHSSADQQAVAVSKRKTVDF